MNFLNLIKDHIYLPQISLLILFCILQFGLDCDIFFHLHDFFKNDVQDPKQLQQPHGSHTVALSQVCPNNLNGGRVLT